MIFNKKPWGCEGLAYQNENVAIWHLFIHPNQETSLHCHPRKKTGLIPLKGVAEVGFLSGKQILKPYDKIMIRHGVFHRTKNIGKEVLQLFEIENPVDKTDLVRIKDKYNRPKSYFTEDTFEMDQRYQWDMSCPKRKQHSFPLGSVRAQIHNLYSPNIYKHMKEHIFCSKCIYAIVEGGVIADGTTICGPGDVVYGNILTMLANEFSLLKSTKALVIS